VRVGRILFFLICIPAYGQRISEIALRIKVAARDVAVIAGQPSKLHWVIDPMPTEVLVTNETLKREMAAALAGMQGRKPNCLVWYAEKSPGDCSFSMVLTQMLNERLSGIGFSFDAPKDLLLLAPKLGSPPPPDGLKASYVPPAITVVNSLKITVSTANSEAGSASRRLCPATEFPIPGAAGGEAVPVLRQYADADLAKDESAQFDSELICRQLLGVAQAAYKEAQSSDLLPKAKSPESRRAGAEQRVQAI
jgi:hypothetical protein